MPPISIHLNTDQAVQYVTETRDVLETLLMSRINALDAMLADRVRENLSGEVLKVQTGRLLGTVTEVPASQDGDVIQGSVTAGGDDAPYGIFFEEGGLGPYLIVPRFANVLAFEMDGKMVFTKLVHHPAIPHLPWFGPAVDEVAPGFQDELETVFKEVLSR